MLRSLLLLLALLQSPGVCEGKLSESEQKAVAEYRLARQAWLEPGITTSLDDANTDVAFLDDFRPRVFYPLAEMPRVAGHGFLLVVPGCYEMDAATFCLHAGSYGPGGGDGYAPAPLQGKAAELIHRALWNWTDHPEIPQSHVQLVVWALAERKEVDRLPPRAQAAVQTLLGSDGIVEANAAARGPEPKIPGISDPTVAAEMQRAGEEMEAAFVASQADLERAQTRLDELGRRAERGENVTAKELQEAMAQLAAAQAAFFERYGPAARRMAEAHARFDKLMTVAEAAFEEIEREAVLQGNPEPPAGSRPIPESRWSYHAGGYFVRYIPEHYSRSRIEVSVSAAVGIQRDAEGRIKRVEDEAGNRLSVAYDDAGRATVPVGDPGVMASALREMTVTPAQGETVRVPGGWTLVGVPRPDGSAQGAPAGRTDLPDRYRRAQRHAMEVSRLVAALSEPAAKPPAEIAIAADIADVVDLAHLADALRDGLDARDRDTPEALAMRLLQQAWQGAVCRRVASLPGARSRPGSRVSAGPALSHGDRLAAVVLPQALWVRAGGSDSSGLPVLDPGWDGINPGNRARQRLGTAPMQHPAADGKRVLRHAVEACEMLQTALDVFNGLSDPVGWLMEKFGLGAGGMPGMMLSEMVQWLFDMGATISEALGGDPPRGDFTSLQTPPPPELPTLQTGDGLSEARASAASSVAADLGGMYASLRAAQVSLDRAGGALQAGDEPWARRQALAFVHYKRRAGRQMVALGESYRALLAVMHDEGVEAQGVGLEQLREHLRFLRDEGLRPDALEAAHRLGLSDEEIEAARQRRLAFAPEDDLDDPLTVARHASGGLRDLGEYWQRMPEVAAPAAP